MKDLRSLLTHPIVLAALGGAVVIALGSGLYYASATRVPAVSPDLSTAATAGAVVASGTVEPAQNPDLAFVSGGRVTRVSASVGQKVSQGQVLASLDTGALSAQLAGAQAQLKSQQAKLSQMQAGARQVDIDAKNTAVAQANLSLSSAYQSVAASVNDAYGKSYDAFHSDTDALFNNPNTQSPTLTFSTNDNANAVSLINQRAGLNGELAAWKDQLGSVSSSASNAALETSLATSLAHLMVLRTYTNTALEVLNSAVLPSGSSVSGSISAVSAMRGIIDGLIASMQAGQQQLASQKLAVQSAQDALAQTLAGSTPEDLEAQQAQVDAASATIAGINAQIGNAIVVAPFAGAVASVHVKVGDVVAPNTNAVSLNPESALQVIVYLSEIDVAKIQTGAQAEVVLDAYGDSRPFAAQVVAVDSSPTAASAGTTGGYKVTLQFTASDPAISSGMGANVTIPVQH